MGKSSPSEVTRKEVTWRVPGLETDLHVDRENTYAEHWSRHAIGTLWALSSSCEAVVEDMLEGIAQSLVVRRTACQRNTPTRRPTFRAGIMRRLCFGLIANILQNIMGLRQITPKLLV